MRANLLSIATIASLLLTACAASGGDSLKVGKEAPGGSGGAKGEAGASAVGGGGGGGAGGQAGTGGAVAGSDKALSVHVEDIQGLTVEIVTIACPGDCVEVKAVAKGGNPPYRYKWEDKSTNAKREICPDATSKFSVMATDTAVSGEFAYQAHTARATVTAKVLECSDAGGPCSVGTAESAATANNLDLFGKIVYFADGKSLPEGAYRLIYEDGCMKYNMFLGWTIHGSDPSGWWLVGDTSADHVARPPGTVSIVAGTGAFDNYDDCVAANKQLPPTTFEHKGGKLGIYLEDFPYQDNVAGAVNPRWRLERLGGCPAIL